MGCVVVMGDRAGMTCTPQPSCVEVTVAAEAGTTTATVTTHGEKTDARTEVAEIQGLKYVTETFKLIYVTFSIVTMSFYHIFNPVTRYNNTAFKCIQLNIYLIFTAFIVQ